MKRATQVTLFLLASSVIATGCGGSKTIPRDARSPWFDDVASHLDLGGEFFLYADIEGDVQRGAELVNEAIRESGKVKPEIAQRIDAVKIADDLGLTGVSALGLSSIKDGDGYLNKGFIQTTGGRNGLLQMFGREPHPFDVLTMAPEDSAIVVERDVNVKVAMDLLTALLDQVEGPARTDELLRDLTEPLPVLGYTPREIIDLLDTRVIAIVRIDQSKTIPVPDFKSRMPMIHVTLAADNLGRLIDPLLKEAGALPSLRRESKGDWDTIELLEPISQDARDYRPVLRRHRPTDRLYLSSDLAFLEDCLNGGPSISENNDFKNAARGLPVDKGNGIFYASPEFFQEMQKVVGELLAEDSDTAWLKAAVGMFMPGLKSGEIGVSINEPDGIYLISRSSFSHKVTLIEGIYLNPLMFGVVAYTVFGRMFNSAQDIAANTDAPETEARLQVEMCYWGAVRHYEAHQTLPPSVDWTPSLAPSATPYPLVPEDWQQPTWQALEFVMPVSHRYQYSFVHTGNEFSCMARGDINGNGVFSLFERKGLISAEGYVEEVGGLIETNPAE